MKYCLPTITLALCTVCTQSLAFDRLFTTAEERAAIDSLRNGHTVHNAASAQKPVSLELNGLLTRSHGKDAAWVNGKTMNELDTVGHSKVRMINNSNVAIDVKPIKGTIKLRPGQRYLSNKPGTIESYEK